MGAAAGLAGDRFAVRNSGATTVIEGCDSNGCEYMTGGMVVILGEVGDNFAAGMTGGMAFVYDKSKEFEKKVNSESVLWQTIETKYWKNFLRELILEHLNETNSKVSKLNIGYHSYRIYPTINYKTSKQHDDDKGKVSWAKRAELL